MEEKYSNLKLGIVCPMANEEETAESFITETLSYTRAFNSAAMYVVLDKACKDNTKSILRTLQAKEDRIRLVWAPENKCVVDAYLRGYREALADGCDWILEMDAGFSHCPSEMPQFFEKMSEGYDCVFGSRFMEGGKIQNSTWKRYLISKGGGLLANLLLGTRLKDMTSGFELFTRETLAMVLDKGIRSRAHFFQTEIKFFCRNLRIAEVPIHYQSPSSNIGGAILADALKNLFRLFKMRISGTA